MMGSKASQRLWRGPVAISIAIAAVLLGVGMFGLRPLVNEARNESESYAYRKLSYVTKLNQMVQQRARAEAVVELLGREFPISLEQADKFLRDRSLKTQAITQGAYLAAPAAAS